MRGAKKAAIDAIDAINALTAPCGAALNRHGAKVRRGTESSLFTAAALAQLVRSPVGEGRTCVETREEPRSRNPASLQAG